jgi:UDP-glucose 4-epimerase
VARATDQPVSIVNIDRRDIDNIRRRVVNIEKARRMLRWSPQTTLERGMRATAEWFREAGFEGQPAARVEVSAG